MNQAAAQIPLVVEIGVDRKLGLRWKSAETQEAVSLAGYTARSQCRPTPGSSQVLWDLTTENGGIVLEPDGDTGLIQLVFTLAVTAGIKSESGYYAVELTNAQGELDRFCEGPVEFSPRVVRDD